MNINLLRAKMVEKGMTQAQTAQAIGVSENTLSRRLSGKREFRLSEIQRLCEVLNINNPVEIFLPKTSQICNDTKTSA